MPAKIVCAAAWSCHQQPFTSRLLQTFARNEMLDVGVTLLVKRHQAALHKLCANGYVKIDTNASEAIILTMF